MPTGFKTPFQVSRLETPHNPFINVLGGSIVTLENLIIGIKPFLFNKPWLAEDKPFYTLIARWMCKRSMILNIMAEHFFVQNPLQVHVFNTLFSAHL